MVNHSYREKLALNNPDVIYAFRPELFSTFEIHSDDCTCRFRREALTVFWFPPQPAPLWRHSLWCPSCLWRSAAASQWACLLPGFISGSTHYPLRGPETYRMKQNANRKESYLVFYLLLYVRKENTYPIIGGSFDLVSNRDSNAL